MSRDQSSAAPPLRGENRVLLLRELEESVKARPLAEFLEQFARVKQLTIPAPDDKPLGYAFVEFFSEADAQRVYEHLHDERAPLFHKRRLHAGFPNLFDESTPNAAPSAPRRRLLGSIVPLGRMSVSKVPRYAALVAALTIGLCFIVAKHLEHIPADLLLVPISFAACGAPERYIYAVGLGVVAALLLFTALLLGNAFAFVAREAPELATFCTGARITGWLTPLALLLQAIVPLDEAALLLLTPRAADAVLGLQSTVHQSAASLFFMLGTAHVYCVINVMSGMRGVAKITRLLPVTDQSFRAKYTCLLVLLLIPVAMALHPAAARFELFELTPDNRLLMAALSQYACVGALLGFFLSYRTELEALTLTLHLGRTPNAVPNAEQKKTQ